MATLGSAFINIRANLAPLRRGLATAYSAVKSSMHRIRTTMHTAARAIRRAMLLATAAITGVIYAAVQFERQIAMVSTMLSTRLMPIMKRYKDSLVDMSKKFGQSTDTLSKGLYNILSASIAPTRAIGVLGVATKMAIAGITDTATATKALVAVLNSYGMEASDANVVSDKLFAALKRGLFTFEEFAGSIGKAAATAALGGVKFEELLATITTTTRAGVSPEETMTAINSTIMAFLKPSKEAKEAAKKFGIELSSAFLKSKGLVAAIKALDKASAEDVMQLIQNRRAFKAMAASLKDVTGLTSDLEFITKGAAGETEKAYRKMAGTTGFQLKRIKECFRAMAIALGTPMLKPLIRLMDEFRRVFEKIENWAAKNKAEIKYWSDVVVDKIQDAIWYVEDLYDVMKHPKGGIGAALKLIYEDIKKGLSVVIDWLKESKAVELGEKIGEGVVRKINEGLEKTWYGKTKTAVTKGAGWATEKFVEASMETGNLWRMQQLRGMGRETIARAMSPGESWWAGQKRGYAAAPGQIAAGLTYPARKLYEQEAGIFRTGFEARRYDIEQRRADETLRVLASIDYKMNMDTVD